MTISIDNATNTVELNDALESELNAIGCELGPSATYEESLEWYEQDGENGCEYAADLLRAAIKKWHKLES